MKTLSMLEFRRNARKVLNAVQRGERVLLTYRGKPVARLEPVTSEPVPLLDGDSLLRVDDFSVDGPGGRLVNEEIDQLVYER